MAVEVRDIPRREDERNLKLAGKHPAYCTCKQCTDSYLKKRKIRPSRSKDLAGEKAKAHPRGCSCATCLLIASVGELPDLPGKKEGFLKRLLRSFR